MFSHQREHHAQKKKFISQNSAATDKEYVAEDSFFTENTYLSDG
jgi:hypothetical protein